MEIVDDAAPIAFLVVLAATSLWLAVRGSRWALAFPATICALGLLAYTNSEPDPPWGGDSDPERLIAVCLLFSGIPWFLVVLLITVAAKRVRGTDDDRR